MNSGSNLGTRRICIFTFAINTFSISWFVFKRKNDNSLVSIFFSLEIFEIGEQGNWEQNFVWILKKCFEKEFSKRKTILFFNADVFAVVCSEEGGNGWRIAIYCDENVPLFGPSLPCPPIFEDQCNFREFLLVKLINGEKATFDTPTFSRKRERTLDTLLRDLYQEHSQESKSNVSSKFHFYFQFSD